MKKNIFILLGYIFCISASAQNTSIYGEYTYWKVTDYGKGVFKSKSIIYFDDTKSLQQVLYIVPRGATDTTLIQPERRESYINKEGQNINKITLSNEPAKAYAPKNMYSVYKNSPKKLILDKTKVFHAGGEGKGDEYILEEKNIDFGWQITNERKKIGEFECIKAISKPFRGRVYEAWFAPEIPINDGPWKLYGLPGFILEAKDQSGEVKFLMEKLSINPNERKIIFDPYENVKLSRITWEDYKKKVKEQENIMFKSIFSKGATVSKYSTKSIEMID